ncbi:unnamed protein product [Rodentolepis nana]|uniref:Nucleolin 1-like n=1 Tax=Rodentolepis nana TaxID=102285 RepID=A0A0R3TLI5_RODNA|nr:unnamed protein product [Rodentolepis nana]
MPRRSSNKSSSPVQRRQSARIAAASASRSPSSTSPSTKRTRRSSKRDSSAKSDASFGSADHNGNESSPKQSIVLEEPPEKKSRVEETNDTVEKDPEPVKEDTPKQETVTDTDASNAEHDVAKDAGFEVVDKASTPSADSEEVKKAIEAQGEDGQLLVNYVQVVKEDVPAVVPEVASSALDENQNQQPTNGTDKGDDAPAEPTSEKHSAEQPKEEVLDVEEASH